MPVLVGIACAGTAETIDLGHHAQEHGADGVMVVNPYYAKLSDDARFMHYKSIADSLKIPVFLYNFPDLTGQDIGLEVITRLAQEVPNIVGIRIPSIISAIPGSHQPCTCFSSGFHYIQRI